MTKTGFVFDENSDLPPISEAALDAFYGELSSFLSSFEASPSTSASAVPNDAEGVDVDDDWDDDGWPDNVCRGPRDGSSIREDILMEANRLVNGARNNEYGNPIADFERTADFWTIYLQGAREAREGWPVLMPHDVAIMMILLKISRITWTPSKRDHWVDIAGYAACGADCSEYENGGLS
jgi:hypothetical protein